MAEDLLSSFRAGYEQSSEAFNEGDIDRALSGMPEELEWHAVNSRGAGVPVEVEIWEVWEFEEMRPVRVRQFLSREEALAADAH